jgi:hypothetical protein
VLSVSICKAAKERNKDGEPKKRSKISDLTPISKDIQRFMSIIGTITLYLSVTFFILGVI